MDWGWWAFLTLVSQVVILSMLLLFLVAIAAGCSKEYREYTEWKRNRDKPGGDHVE